MTKRGLGPLVMFLLLFIVGCSEEGSVNTEVTISENNGVEEKPFTDRVLSLQEFENAFVNRQVSDTSPTGTWIIYANGETEVSYTDTAGNTTNQATTVNLLTAVVSIFVIKNDAGIDEIIMRNCTGGSPSNAGYLSSTLSTPTLNQLSLSASDLKSLFILSDNPFAITGEMANQQGYDDYIDQEIIVSLDNNKKLIFPKTVSYTNSSEIFSTFRYDFKGIKVSDNLDVGLGKFETNKHVTGEIEETHCFNVKNATRTDTTTDITAEEIFSETYNIQVYNTYTMEFDEPDKQYVLYSMLYKALGPRRYKIDGIIDTKFATERLEYNRIRETNEYVVAEGTNSESPDVTTTFDYAEGFTINFAANIGSNGELTGAVEAYLP